MLDNTLANATRASTKDGGLGITGAIGGYPFPIPKTGNEAIWNHLMRYQGVALTGKFDAYNIDAAGTATDRQFDADVAIDGLFFGLGVRF